MDVNDQQPNVVSAAPESDQPTQATSIGESRRSVRWSSPVVLAVVAALVFMLVAGGIYVTLNYHRSSVTETIGEVISSPGSAHQISWSVTPGTLPPAEESDLKSALGTQDLGQVVGSGRDLDITTGYVAGDWGVFYGQMRANDTHEVIASDEITLLAHKSATGWQIVSPESPDFCATLHQIPDTVMSQEGKDYFLGCRNQ